jgi:hypothetical protein
MCVTEWSIYVPRHLTVSFNPAQHSTNHIKGPAGEGDSYPPSELEIGLLTFKKIKLKMNTSHFSYHSSQSNYLSNPRVGTDYYFATPINDEWRHTVKTN